MKIVSLTTAEEQLMQVLWKLNVFYSKDVLENHPEPKPHQNTVSTYLKILVEKNYLKTEKEGRIFKYSVLIPYENYKKFLLENLLNDHFKGDSKNLIQFLLNEKLLNSSDLDSFFEVKATIVPTKTVEKEAKEKPSEITEYIQELTEPKKKKKDKKKKDKKKKKKK